MIRTSIQTLFQTLLFSMHRPACFLPVLGCVVFLLQGQVSVAQDRETGLFVDSRDSGLYSWALMDNGQYWMTTNLNHQPISGNSWCYDYSLDHCINYGRLYDWNTAQSVCPVRWRLPTKEDLESLLNAYGESATESFEGLMYNDYSGFSQRMGGFYNATGQSFYFLDQASTYWTSSSDGDGSAWELLLSAAFSEAIMLYSLGEGGKSVRCVQD